LPFSVTNDLINPNQITCHRCDCRDQTTCQFYHERHITYPCLPWNKQQMDSQSSPVAFSCGVMYIVQGKADSPVVEWRDWARLSKSSPLDDLEDVNDRRVLFLCFIRPYQQSRLTIKGCLFPLRTSSWVNCQSAAPRESHIIKQAVLNHDNITWRITHSNNSLLYNLLSSLWSFVAFLTAHRSNTVSSISRHSGVFAWQIRLKSNLSQTAFVWFSLNFWSFRGQ
jgi:hypothetical protein